MAWAAQAVEESDAVRVHAPSSRTHGSGMTSSIDKVGSDQAQPLESLLGAGGLLVEEADLERYERGARYDSGKALFVARPRTTAEVSRLVRHCVRSGIHMIAQSGNTGLVGGSTPDHSGRQAVISLERLAGAVEVNPLNRTVLAGAGVRLSQLNEALAPHGLFFPIDLGADPMVGGMVATNTGGARFLKYGDVRANLLGLEVVLPDEEGTVVDMLVTPRKSNTGLDLKQLFVGTAGLFGIVTRAVLEVHPLPRQRATAFLCPAGEDSVVALLTEFERRVGEHLSAFEGISREALAMAIRHVPNLRDPFSAHGVPEYCVLVEISRSWDPRGNEQSLDELLTSVLEEIWSLPDSPLADAVIAPPEEAWALRHALSHALADGGLVHALDVGFDREVAMIFRQRARQAVLDRYPHLLVCDFGHIGDGGLHFNIVEPADSGRRLGADEVVELKDLVYDIVLRHCGSFSAEHGIGRNNQRWYRRFNDARTREIAAGIKSLLGTGALGAIDPMR